MSLIKNPRSIEVVTVEEVKKHLRIEHDEENDIILHMIRTATEWAERFIEKTILLQRCIYSWTYTGGEQAFAYYNVYLPCPPVLRVCKVLHTEDKKPVIPVSWDLKSDLPIVFLPRSASSVEITYDAGMAEHPQNLPPDIGYALLMLCSTLYEQRHAPTHLKEHPAMDLLYPYKQKRLF